MNRLLIRQSMRIYNFILKFYPKSYRQEFEEEMKYVFSKSLKDAYAKNKKQGVINLWTRIIFDAGKSIIIQHLENYENKDMKTKNHNTANNNINISRVALVTILVLLVPFIAKQFTSEVNWNETDFIIMGALVFGTALIYELVVKRVENIKHKLVFGIVLLGAFLIIWADLAVGIFNIPGISGS